MIFECWYETTHHALTFSTKQECAVKRRKGEISKTSKLGYRIDVATLTEAMSIHHLRQGWPPIALAHTPPVSAAAPITTIMWRAANAGIAVRRTLCPQTNGALSSSAPFEMVPIHYPSYAPFIAQINNALMVRRKRIFIFMEHFAPAAVLRGVPSMQLM